MGGGVVPDLGQDLGLSRQAVEVAQAELDAARDEVDMGVLKGRQDHAAAEVDDPGRAVSPAQGVAAAADEDDPAPGDGHGLGVRPRHGHGPDGRVRQDEVGPLGGAGRAGERQRGEGGGREREDGGAASGHGPDLLSETLTYSGLGPWRRRRSMAAAAVRASPMARMTVAPPRAMSPPA
jgi:hypothetical protein